MKIIDHLSVGVTDIESACKFYNPVLEQIGGKLLAQSEGLAAYGEDAVEFIAILPFDKKSATGGNGTHICFKAADQQSVDAFHATALENGGTNEGVPGPRTDYPTPNAYAAYVRDPFGNKLEVIHSGFGG